MTQEDQTHLRDRPVTLKVIAKHLGVSVTTVARALKDGHKIGPETVRLVRDTAAELGYERNIDGLRLRTGRTMTLMALLATHPDSELSDGNMSGLISGIHRRLDGTDYMLQAVPYPVNQCPVSVLRRVARQRLADGVFLDQVWVDDPRVAFLSGEGMPFVSLGRDQTAAPHPFVAIDDELGAYQSTVALLSRGFRRIAVVEAAAHMAFVHDRVRGYQRALAEAGIAYDQGLVFHCATPPLSVVEALSNPAAGAAPDAYLCSSEAHMVGTLTALRETGRGFDGVGLAMRAFTNLGAYLSVRVTAALISRDTLGWHMADLLLSTLDGDAPTGGIVLAPEMRDYLPG
ncbi:MAG: LacI family DNA-binding transcriptional regulator [Rhodobacteraceae bacterium]|nr:LacI family DNA-binding transcriptional regulator [Paracoccaceae bacterium]